MKEPTHVQPVSLECVYAEGVRFERCRFAHLNNSGIGFGADCRNNAVVGCVIEDIGGTGVMVGWRGAEGTLDADCFVISDQSFLDGLHGQCGSDRVQSVQRRYTHRDDNVDELFEHRVNTFHNV